MSKSKALPSIYDLKEYEPSKSDTLQKSTVSRMSVFLSTYRGNIYSANAAKPAYYCFQGGIDSYQGSVVKKKSAFVNTPWQCMGQFNVNAHASFTDGLFYLFTRNCRLESNRRFLEYILSPTESPWRNALKHCLVLRDKETDDFPIGLLWTDVNQTDVAQLTNLLITARFISNYGRDAMWCELVDAGFTPDEALIIGHFTLLYSVKVGPTRSLFSKNWKDYFRVRHTLPCSGDQSFTSYFHLEYFDPSRILTGSPKTWGFLPKGTRPNPSNLVWDSDKAIRRIQYSVRDQYNGESSRFVNVLSDYKVDTDGWGILAGINEGKWDSGRIKALSERFQKNGVIDFQKGEKVE